MRRAYLLSYGRHDLVKLPNCPGGESLNRLAFVTEMIPGKAHQAFVDGLEMGVVDLLLCDSKRPPGLKVNILSAGSLDRQSCPDYVIDSPAGWEGQYVPPIREGCP
jgi:hypothetical protein